jgi:hypothetical protein
LLRALTTKIGNHSATGITACLKNSGTLENVAAMADDAPPGINQPHVRHPKEISADGIKLIL